MATTYDFLEVTLGESYLKFDGETPGYADGVGIEAKIEYKTYDFGVPLRRIGKAKIKLTFNADASLKEIRPLNLLMCLGLSEATFQDILGATHTVSNEAKTFSAENGGDFRNRHSGSPRTDVYPYSGHKLWRYCDLHNRRRLHSRYSKRKNLSES